MIIRHAEKPGLTVPPQGIDIEGNPDPHSLTVRGWTRAGALVELFASAYGTPPPGLARPTRIFAAGGAGGQGRRPQQTVVPLASRLRLTVNTQYAKGDEKAITKDAASRPGTSLICWEHEEIPNLAATFSHASPDPPPAWPDGRFDLVWVFAPTATGWSFSQFPQLLLDGDSDQTISA